MAAHSLLLLVQAAPHQLTQADDTADYQPIIVTISNANYKTYSLTDTDANPNPDSCPLH